MNVWKFEGYGLPLVEAQAGAKCYWWKAFLQRQKINLMQQLKTHITSVILTLVIPCLLKSFILLFITIPVRWVFHFSTRPPTTRTRRCRCFHLHHNDCKLTKLFIHQLKIFPYSTKWPPYFTSCFRCRFSILHKPTPKPSQADAGVFFRSRCSIFFLPLQVFNSSQAHAATCTSRCRCFHLHHN